jgi:hypothetical protein
MIALPQTVQGKLAQAQANAEVQQRAQDAANQVMGLVGQRRQLVSELEDLHARQLEIAAQIPRSSGAQRELYETMSKQLERQVAGAENALRAIETLIATRTGSAPPAAPAVAGGEGFAYTTAPPPPPAEPSREGPIFGIAGAALIALSVLGFWNYVRRMRRETRDSVNQLRSELFGEMQKVSIGVDAIAVELERIGEGQRFVTKAIAEKREQVPRAGSS